MKCVNEYRVDFQVACPNNKVPIRYRLRIRTSEAVMVERITEALASTKEAYHEDIADMMFRMFKGQQTLRAYHHGVWIKTKRQETTVDTVWTRNGYF